MTLRKIISRYAAKHIYLRELAKSERNQARRNSMLAASYSYRATALRLKQIYGGAA